MKLETIMHMPPQLFTLLKWILFFFVALLFAYKTFVFIDPDLGWHLRAGEIVQAQSWTPPTMDPWNFTLHSYEWIDHEWLVDGVLFSFWKNNAWEYIQVFFLLIILTPVCLWWKRAKDPIALLVTFLGSGLLLEISGVRPQMISMLLFLICYEILFSKHKYSHIIKLSLPLFFWCWANLHAGFPAGFLLWGAVLIANLYGAVVTNRSTITKAIFQHSFLFELLLLALSLIATTLTPYRLSLWKEIFDSILSPLTSKIAEWQSPFVSVNILVIVFTALVVAFIGVFRSKLPQKSIFVCAIFFLLFLQHTRMLPFFLITLFPLVFACTEILMANLLWKKNERTTVLFTGRLYAGLFLLIVIIYPFLARRDDVMTPYHPPLDAIATLRLLEEEKLISGQIYNTYDFGGWLIYTNPKAQVFVDGRSPHWKNSVGFSPFGLQLEIEREGAEFEPVFHTYNIHVALLNVGQLAVKTHPTFPTNSASDRLQKMFMKLRSTLIEENTQISLAGRLVQKGWCRVYQDVDAVILVEPEQKLCVRSPR